ncbi:MAG: SCO family protein [Alphaproteobacteria bacterium]|nr:SCO family protein [Alphaproteobacteria bacterium]
MPTDAPRPARIAGLIAWGVALGLLFVLWQRPGLLMDLVRPAASTTDCDLAAEPCTVPLAGGGQATITVLPTGLPAGRPLSWTVALQGAPDLRPTALEITGLSMNMGITRLPLLPDGEAWVAEGALPLCTSTTMQWRIDLLATRAGAAEAATLHTWSGRAAGGAADASSGTSSGTSSSTASPHGRAPAPDRPATHGDFTLDTAEGALALSDLQGKVVVLYFGYTSCPDICPTTLAAVGQAFDLLTPDERARVAGLFVSLDPERDALPRLQRYAAWFAPEIRAGTASPDHIARIAADWGVAWRKVPLTDSALGYAIDHSTDAMLVGADGRFLAPIAHGTPPAELAARLRQALAEPQEAPTEPGG